MNNDTGLYELTTTHADPFEGVAVEVRELINAITKVLRNHRSFDQLQDLKFAMLSLMTGQSWFLSLNLATEIPNSHFRTNIKQTLLSAARLRKLYIDLQKNIEAQVYCRRCMLWTQLRQLDAYVAEAMKSCREKQQDNSSKRIWNIGSDLGNDYEDSGFMETQSWAEIGDPTARDSLAKTIDVTKQVFKTAEAIGSFVISGSRSQDNRSVDVGESRDTKTENTVENTSAEDAEMIQPLESVSHGQIRKIKRHARKKARRQEARKRAVALKLYYTYIFPYCDQMHPLIFGLWLLFGVGTQVWMLTTQVPGTSTRNACLISALIYPGFSSFLEYSSFGHVYQTWRTYWKVASFVILPLTIGFGNCPRMHFLLFSTVYYLLLSPFRIVKRISQTTAKGIFELCRQKLLNQASNSSQSDSSKSATDKRLLSSSVALNSRS